MDYLNYQVNFLKGKDILTYYTPCDPTKDKEPLLSKELSQKWLPAKTVAQKDQLEKESEIMAKKILAEGPEERAKRRKKEKKDLKIVRVIKKVPVKFYSCNSSRITNKMPILAHDIEKHKPLEYT